MGFVWAAVSVGILIGPVLGGVLVAFVDWRTIFLVTTPVGVLGSWLAVRFVEETPVPASQRMDFLGAGLLGVSLLCLSLALTLDRSERFDVYQTVGLLAVALATGVGFVARQLRVESPLIDVRILRVPLLWVSVIAGFVSFAASSSLILVMPFYLQDVRGYGAAEMGLLLAVAPLVMGVSSPVAGALSDRFGVRRLTFAGLLILCAAYGSMRVLSETTSAAALVGLWIPIGVGMGLFQSPNNSAIMGAAPPQYAGMASGLLTMIRLLGQLTGVAVIGSIWSTRVMAHAGAAPFGAAGSTSPAAQVAGLHDVVTLASVLLGGAAVLTVWGLRANGNRSDE